jgi:hypothetical protein
VISQLSIRLEEGSGALEVNDVIDSQTIIIRGRCDSSLLDSLCACRMRNPPGIGGRRPLARLSPLREATVANRHDPKCSSKSAIPS